MPTLNICNECGAEISKLSPLGLCTRCLFELGLASDKPLPDVSGEQQATASGRIACPPAVIAQPHRRFGDFELLEEIARGGMGIVWKARQISLNRIVAVKMILSGELARPEELTRFQAEAEAAGKLQHPHIVRIYGAGMVERQPYFAMDYIDGPNLATEVRDRPMGVLRAAECIKKIAEAIHYAHEHGVLHRDLKPSNILIDQQGQPHVTDFGLAKQLQFDSTLTITGHFLGSPNYMAPEQADGRHEKLGRATDIYSLGAMLYHVLTGQPPFAGRNLTDTLQAVRHEDPPPVRTMNPSAPRALETICHRCLEKCPERRYRTALELSEELARFLNSQPILTKPLNAAQKLLRWCERHPLATAGTFVLLATIIVATASVIYTSRSAARREQTLRERAQILEKQAVESARLATINAYAADLSAAYALSEKGEPERARELLQRYAGAEHASLRGFEWGHLWRKTGPGPVALDQLDIPHPWWLSSNGMSFCRFYSPDDDKFHFQIWDLKKTNVANELVFNKGQVTAWDISRNIKWVAVLTPQRQLQIWDIESADLIVSMPVSLKGHAHVGFSIDSKSVFVSTGKDIQIFEAPTLKRKSSLTNIPIVTHLYGDILFGWDPHRDSDALLYHAQDGHLLARLAGHSKKLPTLDTSWDGKWVATPSDDGTVRVWSVPEGKLTFTLAATINGNNIVQFSPNGRTLATAGNDGTVKLWNLESGRQIVTFKNPPDAPLEELMFSGNGQALVAYDVTGKLTVWRAAEY